MSNQEPFVNSASLEEIAAYAVGVETATGGASLVKRISDLVLADEIEELLTGLHSYMSAAVQSAPENEAVRAFALACGNVVKAYTSRERKLVLLIHMLNMEEYERVRSATGDS